MNGVRGSLLVVVAGLALLTGCAGGQADEEINFLRQKPSDAPDMTGLTEGRLVLSEGCLRIQNDGTSHAAIWPFEFDVNVRGDSVDILDEDEVVTRVGDQIEVGGGEVRIMSQEEFDRTYLGALQCSGPYWLVTEVIETTP